MDENARIYLSDFACGRVVRYDAAQMSIVIDGLNQPAGSALDAQRNLYIAEYGGRPCARVAPGRLAIGHCGKRP